MATFFKGVNGAYSGKIGNVIGSNWRDISYIRSLSRRSKKVSQAQMEQRVKFALMADFLGPISGLLNRGFTDITQARATGYNIAFGGALRSAIVGEYPNYSIDFPRIVISRGTLGPLYAVQWQISAPMEIKLSWWQTDNKQTEHADDSVVLLVYNIERKLFNQIERSNRADEVLTYRLPALFAGDTIVGWVFAASRGSKHVSPSHYLGALYLQGE